MQLTRQCQGLVAFCQITLQDKQDHLARPRPPQAGQPAAQSNIHRCHLGDRQACRLSEEMFREIEVWLSWLTASCHDLADTRVSPASPWEQQRFNGSPGREVHHGKGRMGGNEREGGENREGIKYPPGNNTNNVSKSHFHCPKVLVPLKRLLFFKDNYGILIDCYS